MAQSDDIIFSLNKQVGAALVACKDGGLIVGGQCGNAPAFFALEGSSSVSGSVDEGSFCVSLDNFDSAVFKILLEFNNIEECESSLDEDAGYCCMHNDPFQLDGWEDTLTEWGLTPDMFWYSPDRVCLDGRPCQFYFDGGGGVTTESGCAMEKLLLGLPKAVTQEQLDGFYPLMDSTFTPICKVSELWSQDINSEDYCPFGFTVHDPYNHSSSSSEGFGGGCDVLECGCDPALSPCYSLDCGLFPGGNYVVDCDLCECVQAAVSSSSVSSVFASSSSSYEFSSSSSVSGVEQVSSSASSGGGGSGGGGSSGSSGGGVATHVCVRNRSAGLVRLDGVVELKDLVPTYTQSSVRNIGYNAQAAASGEMTNGATYDSSYPIYQTMTKEVAGGPQTFNFVQADYGQVGYFKKVRVGPPPCYKLTENSQTTEGAANGAVTEDGGCDGSYYYSASVEYSVDGDNWLTVGSTTYAPFFNDAKTLVGTELVGDETVKEARYLRVVGNGVYLGLSELHAADDTLSDSYCLAIAEYNDLTHELVSGPYGSLVSCTSNCPPPPLSFVCVREKASPLIGRLDLPELGDLVATYTQSNVIDGMNPATSGEMTNGTVYDSSYPIYQTMVSSVQGVAWIRLDYGQVGRFRKVRVGPPPCYNRQGLLIGAKHGELVGFSGGCSGEYYIGATVQYSVDGVQWFDLGQTTAAAFLNESKTLVGTELVGDETVKEARFIRLYGGGSNFLAASELTAVRLDVDFVESSSVSSPYLGDTICVTLQEYDSAVYDLVSGPHSDYDICVVGCAALVE